MTEIHAQAEAVAKKAQSKAKKEDLSYLQKLKYYTVLVPATKKVSAASKQAKASLKKLEADLKTYKATLGTAIAAAKTSEADAVKAIKGAGKDKNKIGLISPLAGHAGVLKDILGMQDKKTDQALGLCGQIEDAL